jgi:hypothetical protein
MKNIKAIAAAIVLGSTSVASAAPAVLDTGIVQMGLFDNGGLGGAGVGLSSIFRAPGDNDAITPGCLCEGWGASASGSMGGVYQGSGDSITSALLTVTEASGPGIAAKSVSTLSNGLQVTHTYSYAASGNLFKVAVEMKNVSGGLLTDIRYARTLDWDVPPGHFSDDFTTIYGGTPTGPGGKVLHTSTDPFAFPEPLSPRIQNANTNVVDAPGDLGGFFIFGFGDLADGDSYVFDTFIGAGRDTAQLLAALGSVGVEAYSYTFDNDAPLTYGYGFAGLGLPPAIDTDVPTPASIALFGAALAGLGLARRRKSA